MAKGETPKQFQTASNGGKMENASAEERRPAMTDKEQIPWV